MKKEINFTAVAAIPTDLLQSLLDEFEAKHDIHVNLTIVDWDLYRSEFVNIALQRRPVDLSLVGAPITSDLIGMNVLRPFSLNELAAMGGQSAFLPARWQSVVRPGDAQVWALPFLMDIRVLYYWRDMLAEAGVNEETAFASIEQFEHTLESLRNKGLAAPWSSPDERYALLHAVASWIWARGGDLFAPDGKRVVFHEDVSLDGIRAYFKSRRYASQGEFTLGNNPTFMSRKVAISVGNGWAVTENLPAELGCAPLPGGSYLGGVDMIVWNHTRSENAVLELVRFLSQVCVTERISPQTGLLPLRLSELTALAEHASPVHRTLAHAALSGRTFPCMPMVGLVEDRLSAALMMIQQELNVHPYSDLNALLQSRIVPLGKRTNLSLNG